MANEIEIVVTGKDQSGKKAIDDAASSVDKLGKSAKDAGGLTRAILQANEAMELKQRLESIGNAAKQFLGDSVRAASNLGESLNAVQRIFGSSSLQIEQWGETNANSFGLSRRAFNEMAVPIGASLKNQGLALQDTADHTIRLTERAADMASVFNTDVSDALAAIQAGLRGEADPLERFGVGLSAAKVEAQALADTGKTLASELTEQEKTLARLNLLYAQTNDVAGDFAATSDGLANAQRISAARMEEAQAAIGERLLPIMATASEATADLLGGFLQLPPAAQAVASTVAIVAAGLLILAPRVDAARNAMIAFGLSSRAANLSLGAIGVALTALSTIMIIFGSRTDQSKGNVEEFQATLDSATGAITDNTRALALQQLEQSGAAAAAEKLKVSQRDLVDAALGNVEANQRLIAAWDEANNQGARGSATYRELLNAYVLVRDNVDGLSNSLSASQEAHKRAQEAGVQTGQASRELADAAQEASEDLTEAWQEASEKFIDSTKAMNEASSKLEEGQKLTTDMLLKELERQVKAQDEWHLNMIELAQRVPPALHDELARMGPEGAEQVELLNSMTDRELRQWISNMERRGRTAGGQLISAVQDNFVKGAPVLRAIAEQEGERVANKIAKGMRDRGSTVEAEARRIGLRIDRGIGGDRTVRITPVIQPTQGHLPGQFNASGGIGRPIERAQSGGMRGGSPIIVNDGLTPEAIITPDGSMVIPSLDQAHAMMGSKNDRLALEVSWARTGDEILDAIAKGLRIRIRGDSGGDQEAFWGGN